MNFQDKFNRQIVELFDNLQKQVDTLAGEIAEIRKETNHRYNQKLPKNWGKIKVNGELVDFNTLNTFEEYDKQLDKILEDKEWDSYFEERIDQTEKDTEIILNCLRYCRHRMIHHPESGIHKVDVKLKEVRRLIKELE